jgi:signal transduction histidine kinase
MDVSGLSAVERELRATRERVAEELGRMTRLHALGADLMAPGDAQVLLGKVLEAATDITPAAMGTIQVCDPTGVLTIEAQIGFEAPFLEFFARVDAHSAGACQAAMTARRRVVVEDVAVDPIIDGPTSAVPRAAGVRAVQSTPLFDRTGGLVGVFSTHYPDVHPVDEAELKWIDLLARHAADVIERQRAAALLALSHRELEIRVAERTRWLTLMHDVARAINDAPTWDAALHRVLRRVCELERWQIGFVYLPQPGADRIAPAVSCFGDERFRSFHELSMEQTYGRGDRLPGRVFADNRAFWAVDAAALASALPVRAAAAAAAGIRAAAALPVTVRGEVVAVFEIFSDRPHPPDDQLSALMQSVGDQIGRVLEREKATARMAELVWREQQDLLHTLHDSLGQTLTGLGMLSTSLQKRVDAVDPGASAVAVEIARQSQHALDQVRQLAKSLFPVEVDAETLMAALGSLAAATEGLHHIRVRVEDEAPGPTRDGKTATELYRIAQEAVTNSVKHGRATAITIRLRGAAGLTQLQIADDGVGIPQPEPTDGAGLRIMRYRAASIGASLAVERGPSGGTVVTCTVRDAPVAREEQP